MKVLIADDHAIVRRGLQQILSDEYDDIEFGETGSAQETVDAVWREKWDVLVLDITMPGRSGLEALKDIHKECPELPVLVLSMHPEDQFARRALKAGASGYMTKETAPEKLVNAIDKIMSGGKYVSETLAEQLAEDLGKDDASGADHDRLSDREFEVLREMASGLTGTEIGDKLKLSPKTISTYRARILQKMGLRTNAELTLYAVKHGLVD